MTDDVYTLAQGPLHLAREKREQTSGIDVDMNGEKNCTINFFEPKMFSNTERLPFNIYRESFKTIEYFVFVVYVAIDFLT